MALQHFIPFEVLYKPTILDLDGIHSHFVKRNRGGGNNMSRATGGGWERIQRSARIGILRNVTMRRPELNIGRVGFVIGWRIRKGGNISPANAHEHRAAGSLRVHGGRRYR